MYGCTCFLKHSKLLEIFIACHLFEFQSLNLCSHNFIPCLFRSFPSSSSLHNQGLILLFAAVLIRTHHITIPALSSLLHTTTDASVSPTQSSMFHFFQAFACPQQSCLMVRQHSCSYMDIIQSYIIHHTIIHHTICWSHLRRGSLSLIYC